MPKTTIPFWFLCVLLVLAMMPVGHSIVMLLRHIESFAIWGLSHLLIGFIGVWLVYKGNKKSELKASIYGFLAAHLMFIGFFEFSFAFIAKVMDIQPILSQKSKEVLLAPSLQVVELSGLFLLPLILLMSINQDVRCNMMMWIRRQLRLQIKLSSSRTGRPYSSVTASETLFVIWTIYVISLICLDPRVLGPSHWVSMLVYTVFMFWPFYLIYRLRQFRGRGYIFRYGIPVGVLLWSWVEMLSSMNIVKEYYLYPLQYPLAAILPALLAILIVAKISGRN